MPIVTKLPLDVVPRGTQDLLYTILDELQNNTPASGTVTSVTGTAPIAVATGTTTPVISITAATTLAAGSMSAADKTKLDGIEALADVTDAVNIGTAMAGATAKTTPVDADTFPLNDSAAANVLKKVTWANIKATLLAYLNTASNIEIGAACSDETTALAVADAVLTFRIPRAMTITSIKSSVTTAPTGAELIIDVNKNGTTVFSTLLSIDATEKTSVTAAVPAVLSTTALAADDEITVDITQIGSTIAGAGLKIWMLGTRA